MVTFVEALRRVSIYRVGQGIPSKSQRASRESPEEFARHPLSWTGPSKSLLAPTPLFGEEPQPRSQCTAAMTRRGSRVLLPRRFCHPVRGTHREPFSSSLELSPFLRP